jgi:hypothetical protein
MLERPLILQDRAKSERRSQTKHGFLIYTVESNPKGDIHINTRQQVIEKGLQFLTGVGANAICKVCISNGGSCCSDCSHLKEGEGCQSRNTSCTAWLCGFLKYLLYEVGLLSEWQDFWETIPGLDFRQDSTPSTFAVEKELTIPYLPAVGESFAKDLELILQREQPIESINDLKTHLNICIELITHDKGSTEDSESIYRRLNEKRDMFNHLQCTLGKL